MAALLIQSVIRQYTQSSIHYTKHDTWLNIEISRLVKHFDDAVSEKQGLDCGVPQGSIIGRLLLSPFRSSSVRLCFFCLLYQSLLFFQSKMPRKPKGRKPKEARWYRYSRNEENQRDDDDVDNDDIVLAWMT